MLTCSCWVRCRGQGNLIFHPEDLIVVCLVLVLLAQHAIACWRPPLKVSVVVLCRPHQPLQNTHPSGHAHVAENTSWCCKLVICNCPAAVLTRRHQYVAAARPASLRRYSVLHQRMQMHSHKPALHEAACQTTFISRQNTAAPMRSWAVPGHHCTSSAHAAPVSAVATHSNLSNSHLSLGYP